MKNLVGPMVSAVPVPADTSDGVLMLAAEHLTAIKYPNRLTDVAVVGTLRHWHRSFLLRPKYGGRFAFLMHPRNVVEPQTMILREFRVESFNSPPVVIDITIPAEARFFDTWQWRVVKTGGVGDEEDHFEEVDALEIADGRLTGASSASLAHHAVAESALSTLIFDIRPVMSGEVVFDRERDSARSKLAVWSCHQPYASPNGRPSVKDVTVPILTWYRRKVESFSPHRIWMLGDSVYSDGTGTLNFVSQVYDRAGWQDSAAMRKDLLSLYRLNYRHHWGFTEFQAVTRRFPHLGMWDDHEIRDGYGSEESDFRPANQAIKQIATQAAQEYLFQYSPTLRSESTRNSSVDKHQAYVDGPLAAFIFDGRNSRNYGENMPIPSEVPVFAGVLAGLLMGGVGGAVLGAVGGVALSAEIVDVYRWHNPGEVVSDLQLQDFKGFCSHLKGQSQVKYLALGNSVPFIYILDFVESVAAESAIAGTSTGQEMRDDIRDSWHSPANRRQLGQLIDVLRDLHRARPDIEIINLSGDIHLSNAYAFQPDGFSKPMFQVTSSALTNDPPSAEGLLSLVSVGGPLSFNAKSDLFGPIQRLWHIGDKQNFLTIEATAHAVELHLHTFDKANPASQAEDRILTIRPEAGYTLVPAPAV